MQRSEIISAAAQIFRVKGYQAASMQDIADAVHLLEHRSLEPELLERHIRRRDRYERLWRDLIRQGVEDGCFRELDEKITSFALLGIQNWMITWFRRSGGLKAEALAEIFTNLVLQGMSPRQGSIGN